MEIARTSTPPAAKAANGRRRGLQKSAALWGASFVRPPSLLRTMRVFATDGRCRAGPPRGMPWHECAHDGEAQACHESGSLPSTLYLHPEPKPLCSHEVQTASLQDHFSMRASRTKPPKNSNDFPHTMTHMYGTSAEALSPSHETTTRKFHVLDSGGPLQTEAFHTLDLVEYP